MIHIDLSAMDANETKYMWTSRLLATVLKEGVQFWYNDTSTVKRWGGV
jgi:hypothetical protein